MNESIYSNVDAVHAGISEDSPNDSLGQPEITGIQEMTC